MGSMPITLLDFINKRCRSRTAFEGNYKPVSPSTSESSWGGWGPRTVLLAPLVAACRRPGAAYLCGYSSHGIDTWIPMGPSRLRLEDGLILRDLAVKHLRLDGARVRMILQTSDGSGAYSKKWLLDAAMGVQMAYATHWGYKYLRWDGVGGVCDELRRRCTTSLTRTPSSPSTSRSFGPPVWQSTQGIIAPTGISPQCVPLNQIDSGLGIVFGCTCRDRPICLLIAVYDIDVRVFFGWRSPMSSAGCATAATEGRAQVPAHGGLPATKMPTPSP
jgi:hypothetical protein